MPEIDTHEIVRESDGSFSVVITLARVCDCQKRSQLIASLANYAATQKMLDVLAMPNEQIDREWLKTIWATTPMLR